MPATIRGIFIASAGGEPLEAVSAVEVEEGRGIVGDRYHTGTGSFSDRLKRQTNDDWQVTLIESEEIDRFLDEVDVDLGYGDFRRNLVTTGVRLNPLQGSRHRIVLQARSGCAVRARVPRKAHREWRRSKRRSERNPRSTRVLIATLGVPTMSLGDLAAVNQSRLARRLLQP